MCGCMYLTENVPVVLHKTITAVVKLKFLAVLLLLLPAFLFGVLNSARQTATSDRKRKHCILLVKVPS